MLNLTGHEHEDDGALVRREEVPAPQTPEELEASALETFSSLMPQVRRTLEADEDNEWAAGYLRGDLETDPWTWFKQQDLVTFAFAVTGCLVLTIMGVAGVAVPLVGVDGIARVAGIFVLLTITAPIMGAATVVDAVQESHEGVKPGLQGKTIAEAVARVRTPLGQATRYALERGTPLERETVAELLQRSQALFQEKRREEERQESDRRILEVTQKARALEGPQDELTER